MEMKKNRKHAVWAEINVDALRHNYRALKKHVQEGTKICGVVKANAYGHSVIPYAKYLLDEGIDYFAVARIDEAIQLRKAGVTDTPILIFGYVDKDDIDLLLHYGLTVNAYELGFIKSLNDGAKTANTKGKIHIKIDTGMGRLGFPSTEETITELAQLKNLDNIVVQGIFTHFATADSADKSYFNEQADKFEMILAGLRAAGVDYGLVHCGNSATIIDMPDYQYDMVRPGIMLYGLYPSDEVHTNRIDLRPVMTLKARIAYLKTVEEGKSISYGRLFTTERESRIASLTIGYADGIDRLLSQNLDVLINGQRAPQVGRICMDQMMVDVTDIEGDIAIGDEVVLFGDEEITVDEMADRLGTINYDILCKIHHRVPRVFVNDEGDILQEVNENC